MPRFAERKVLPYAQGDLFDLVADIDSYPQFLPWCLDARVTRRDGNVVYADLVIGWKMIRERFSSRVTLTHSTEIKADYLDGPMRYLVHHWRFEPQPNGHTLVDILVDFEFKSKSLQLVMGTFFNEAARRMVSAFEARARRTLKPLQ